MTREQQDRKALEYCTKGNAEAMDFLTLWNEYVHRIDDWMDGDMPNREEQLGTFALAIVVYSHPFYLRNLAALKQIALNCTNAYADTLAWERSKEEWQKQWADHYRHFGAEMVLAVAGICGGYAHMRAISLELRTICYMEHHNAKGEAI